jgi:UMF1 family MFS transporter
MDQRRKILAWALYDWGNSAYSTTVLAVVLQTYIVSITPENAPLRGPALWSLGVFLSALLSFLITPILGAVADYTNSKKRLWTAFMLLGSLCTMAMFTVTPEAYGWGVALTILSSIGFSGAFVFYNAFLPEIASPGRRDGVSALGFGLGYLGGGLLLAVNLALIVSAEGLGMTTETATRISLASAGLWWLVFSIPMWRAIHDAPRTAPPSQRVNFVTAGFRQLGRTLREVRRYPQAFRFLVAFLLYNDGIQTVIALSATFGLVEIGLGQSTLVGVVLMVQFLAFVSALAFGPVARAFGAKLTVMGSLAVWTLIVVAAYLFVYQEWQFWALGGAVALVLGGSQAISRSLYAQLVPLARTAEFFSFYEISDKVSSLIGPLVFAVVNQLTGSVRLGLLALIVFFIFGMILLRGVDVTAGMRDAQRANGGTA